MQCVHTAQRLFAIDSHPHRRLQPPLAPWQQPPSVWRHQSQSQACHAVPRQGPAATGRQEHAVSGRREMPMQQAQPVRQQQQARSMSALQLVAEVVHLLEQVDAEYTFLGRAAALVQGVQLEVHAVQVAVQWDRMAEVHGAFASDPARTVSPLETMGSCSWFWSRHHQGITSRSAADARRSSGTSSDGPEHLEAGGLQLPAVLVCCQQGTVVAADAHRVQGQVTGAHDRTLSGREASSSGASTIRPPPHKPGSTQAGVRPAPAAGPGSAALGLPPSGGTGVPRVWARSLNAVWRQAHGLPSSTPAVILPERAWREPANLVAAPTERVAAHPAQSSWTTDVPRSGPLPDAGLAARLTSHLSSVQEEVGRVNAAAWGGQDTYEAWCTRFGTPAQAAARIAADPAARLGPLLPHLQDLAAAFQLQRKPASQGSSRAAAGPSGREGGGGRGRGRGLGRASQRASDSSQVLVEDSGQSTTVGPKLRVANLMGSHGGKAVAMALCPGLLAQPAVVDISEGNARYARQLAAAAGVDLDYHISDVLTLTWGLAAPDGPLRSYFHGVVMEMGILHYFVDLQPLMAAIVALLMPGGRLVLRDFHPISTKLISSRGRKHKVEGDYFSAGFAPSDVAYSKFTPLDSAANGTGLRVAQQPKQVLMRKWTLGEIVTAAADAGLVLLLLEEEQGVKGDDKGLPKAFTLVARKL